MRKCIVGGVLLFNGSMDRVLLIKHKKLGVWIYPGGHMRQDENPFECALRETFEETRASFRVISSTNVEISGDGAVSLPNPLIIMKEIVPYREEPHEHFDMIYLGLADDDSYQTNDESSDSGWFSEDQIEELDTFDNVKSIIRYGFDVIRHRGVSDKTA
ncbi:MAG: NUDIX domain-containing protein [Thermoplasmatales archaeon]